MSGYIQNTPAKQIWLPIAFGNYKDLEDSTHLSREKFLELFGVDILDVVEVVEDDGGKSLQLKTMPKLYYLGGSQQLLYFGVGCEVPYAIEVNNTDDDYVISLINATNNIYVLPDDNKVYYGGYAFQFKYDKVLNKITACCNFDYN